MNDGYFFRCCRDLVSLRWKVRCNRFGQIYVYRWIDRLVENQVPCLHPAVAVANEVNGYRPLGKEDIDVPVSIEVLALPKFFSVLLAHAVVRKDHSDRNVADVRARLLASLNLQPCYEPDLNALRVPIIQ